jgi:uncharacterized membrane protein
MKKIRQILVIFSAISYLIGLSVYRFLPDKVASHWNIRGEVDGYSGPFFGAFFFPLMITGLSILLYWLPLMDPLSKNIEKFRKHYANFLIAFFAFMYLIYAQTILWAYGYHISPMIVFPIGFAGLLWAISSMMEHAEQNWSIGIRTPWTMSSKKVWDKTHLLGGKMYKFAALISLLGLVTPKYSFVFVVAPILSVSLYLVFYSYLEYKKEQK